jgi:hypothetical protein
LEESFKSEASWVPKTSLFQRKVAEVEHLRGECRDALLVQAQLRSDKEAAIREIAQLQAEYENFRLMLSHHEVRVSTCNTALCEGCGTSFALFPGL